MEKQNLRQVMAGGMAYKVQRLTGGSTATQVLNHGVTYITSTAGGTAATHAYGLQNPQAGLRKVILADVNSTREVKVITASTTVLFYGSTNNAIIFSTGAVLPKRIELVGLSGTEWAVIQTSTGVSLAGSTI